MSKTLVFGPLDSGVIWRAEKPGTVFFTGATEILGESFAEWKDGMLAASVGDVACSISRPIKEITVSPIPLLFLNGRKMPNAVWPNEGWATIREIIDSGSAEWTGDLWGVIKGRNVEAVRNPRGGVFAYDGTHPNRWANPSKVLLHGFWAYDWSDSIIPVAAVDVTNKTIRLAAPHRYGVKQGNPQPRRWRALNVREEIDQPGEYALDLDERKIYFRPPESFRKGDRLALACNDFDLVRLDGAHDVTFEGVVFEESYRNAIGGSNATNIVFCDCLFRNVREWAAVFKHATHVRFMGCDAHDLGMGGFWIEGGDRRALMSGENVVEDCRLHAFSQIKQMSTPGVKLEGVGNVIRHCEFFDCPHQAIALSESNESIVEYTIVSNACQSADDASAFYMGLNPSARGNILRYNYWKDIGRPMGHGNCAVYFDDGTMGETVFGNVFERCGEPGKGSMGAVFSHGGYSNICVNCIFASCRRALGSGPWNDERWEKYVTSSVIRKKMLIQVCVTNEPYVSRYPDLLNYLDPKCGIQRDNFSATNAIVGCDETYRGRWATNGTDRVLEAHTPFDAIPSAVPGFQPIPFSEIGLRTKKNRPEERVQ